MSTSRPGPPRSVGGKELVRRPGTTTKPTPDEGENVGGGGPLRGPLLPPQLWRRGGSGSEDGYQRFQRPGGGDGNTTLYKVLGLGTLALLGYIGTHLERVPISGRMRFMHTSPKYEEMIQRQSYAQVLSAHREHLLPSTNPYCQLVQRVAARLIRAGGMDQGETQWQVFVIQDGTMNAFVLPGGKIFVCTGMFRVLESEDALAVVLGHEIAHQLARHTSEVLSRFQLFIFFQTIFSLLISPISSYSPFLELGIKRPHSRKLELEADYIGLHLVARACYDPEVASSVWRKMQEMDRHAPPEFFSTHPSHANRIERIQEWMPTLRRVREEADCSVLHSHLGVFRRWT